MTSLSQSSISALIQPMVRVIQRYRPQLVSPTAQTLLDNYMLHLQNKTTFEYHAPSMYIVSDIYPVHIN